MNGWSSMVSRGGGKPPRLTLVSVFIAALAFLVNGPASELLVFDREQIALGQWWRLLSGHWVHSDLQHLLWNLAGLSVLGLLFEPLLGARRMFQVLVTGMLVVDLCLWFLLPELLFYCGLSGILNTLLFAGLWLAWRDRRHPVYLLVGSGALVKVVIETFMQTAVFTDTLWPSVPLAHLSGLVAALVWMYLPLPR